MTVRTTFVLLFLVLFLVFVLFMLDKSTSGETHKTGPLFPDFRSDEAVSIRMTDKNLSFECVKKDGGWYLSRPIRTRADTAILRKIFSGIESLHCYEVITDEQIKERDLRPLDFGLAPPQSIVEFKTRTQTYVIELGDLAPLSDLLYAKTGDQSGVLSIHSSFRDYLPKSLFELRDKYVFRRERTRVHRMEIHYGGHFIQMAKIDGEWRILQPFPERADGVLVSQLIDSLLRIKVEEFIWDPPLTPDGAIDVASVSERARGNLEAYGLASDVAVARAALWSEGDEMVSELILGKNLSDNDKLLAARMRGNDNIFAVGRDILEAFAIQPEQFRDRHLFPLKPTLVTGMLFETKDKKLELQKDPKAGWQVTQPVLWQADDYVVNDLLSRLSRLSVISFDVEKQTTNLFDLGLAPPAISITQTAENTQADQTDVALDPARNASTVMISALPGNGTRFVAFGDQLNRGEIDEKAFFALPDNLLNPLYYRDRLVMSLDTKSIKTVSIIRGDFEQTVGVSSNGEWFAVAPEGRSIDEIALTDILIKVANMRALSLEEFDPAGLPGYGIDDKSVKLVLGLTGEAGIQKTLQFGFKAGKDGAYAMIKGQDILFVLKNEDVKILSMTEILLPADTTPVSSESRKE